MKSKRDILRLDVLSWAVYDFAHTIYSMNILSLYFAGWLVVDLGYPDIYYSVAFSGSMLLAAFLMPAMGYFTDTADGKIHKRLIFLLIFTVGAVISTAGLALFPPGAIVLILLLFASSSFFYEGGIVFYNALLSAVSNEKNMGKVSGFGVATGYLGSIAGMIMVLPFVTGSLFGLKIPWIEGGGKVGAFLPTAVFYAIFAVPIFIFVRGNGNGQAVLHTHHKRRTLREAYRDIWESLKATEKYPGLLRFLIADYFIEDAVATVIIFMGVFTEKVLGLNDSQRTAFFITSTVFAMIGAYLLGLLADRVSPKKVMIGVVVTWIVVLVAFAINSIPSAFWVLGPIVGVVLGGLWAVARIILIQLSPKEKLGEFFGLYSLSGRAAAVGGPLIWGAVVLIFSPERPAGRMVAELFGFTGDSAARMPYRLAVLALAAMMCLGLFILRKIPDKKVSA